MPVTAFRLINELLDVFPLEIDDSFPGELPIQRVIRTSTTIDAPESNTLYITIPEVVSAVIPCDDCIFLCICSESERRAVSASRKQPVVFFLSDAPQTDGLALYNRTAELMSRLSSTEDIYSSLFAADGMKELLNRYSTLIGKPIILTSDAHKVLSFSNSVRFLNSAWRSAVESGHFTLASFFSLRWRAKADESRNHEIPVVLKADPKYDNPYSVIIKVITLKGNAIGHLFIVGQNDLFTEDDLQYTTTLSRLLLGDLIARKNYISPKEGITGLLSELLENSALSRETINALLAPYNWHPGPLIYVLSLPSTGGAPFELDALQRTLPLSANDRITLHHNYPVIVASRSVPLSRGTLSEDPLLLALSQSDYTVGISRQTDYLKALTTSFFQARFAVDYGERFAPQSDGIYFYDDLWIYDLFSHVEPHNVLDAVCFPAVRELVRYDHEHHGDLVKTLSAYLDNNCLLVATSQKMFLHRNTVKYRISRCEDILGLDLSDSQIAMGVMISLRILHYIEKTTEYDAN